MIECFKTFFYIFLHILYIFCLFGFCTLPSGHTEPEEGLRNGLRKSSQKRRCTSAIISQPPVVPRRSLRYIFGLLVRGNGIKIRLEFNTMLLNSRRIFSCALPAPDHRPSAGSPHVNRPACCCISGRPQDVRACNFLLISYVVSI